MSSEPWIKAPMPRLTKEPLGGDRYRISADAFCAIMLGCSPKKVRCAQRTAVLINDPNNPVLANSGNGGLASLIEKR